MQKLILILKPIIDYLKQKYDETTLQNFVKYGLIAIIVLFIITRMSGVIVWMAIGLVTVFGIKKLYENVIQPLLKEGSEEESNQNKEG